MKWTDSQVSRLKELCYQGVSNKEIAADLKCSLEDVYAKRSQLGITIDKCKGKGMSVNPEFEQAIQDMEKAPGGLRKDVKAAFKNLHDAVLVAMARDWRTDKEVMVYTALAGMVAHMEEAFDSTLKLPEVRK
jgi:hypothetical protein